MKHRTLNKTSNSSKLVLPVVLACMGFSWLICLAWLSQSAFDRVSDLPEFYVPLKMILNGLGAKIYDLTELARVEHFYFPLVEGRVVALYWPPVGIPFLLPLGLVPVEVVLWIWKSVLIICLLFSILFLRLTFRLSAVSTAWLAAILFFSGSIYEALRIDQVATILFMFFAAALWALKKKRPYLAAIALAGLLGKPQEILPFIVFLGGARQYKTVWALCLLTLALTLVAFLLIGQEGFSNYASLINSSIADNSILVSDISCTLRGQLFRLFPDSKLSMHYTSLFVLSLSLLAIFFLGAKVRYKAKWLELGLISVMPLGLVSAPYCYYYDLLLIVPSALLLMTEFEPELPPFGILCGMLGGLGFMLPFSIFIHSQIILKGAKFNPHFFLLLAFAVSCWCFVNNKIRAR